MGSRQIDRERRKCWIWGSVPADRPEGERPYVRKMILDTLKPSILGEIPLDVEKMTAKLGLQFNIGPKAYGISGIPFSLLFCRRATIY